MNHWAGTDCDMRKTAPTLQQHTGGCTETNREESPPQHRDRQPVPEFKARGDPAWHGERSQTRQVADGLLHRRHSGGQCPSHAGAAKGPAHRVGCGEAGEGGWERAMAPSPGRGPAGCWRRAAGRDWMEASH